MIIPALQPRDYRIKVDKLADDLETRILELIVQTVGTTYKVTLKKNIEEDYFEVVQIVSGGYSTSTWHNQLEKLTGRPTLVQIKDNFYIAVIGSNNLFNEVVRVIPFYCLVSNQLPKEVNVATQERLKEMVASELLIGWYKDSSVERSVPNVRLVSDSSQKTSTQSQVVDSSLTKRERKVRRQAELEARPDCVFDHPVKGRRSGKPTTGDEWLSLKDKTRVILYEGRANSGEFVNPLRWFVVDKSKPSKPGQVAVLEMQCGGQARMS